MPLQVSRRNLPNISAGSEAPTPIWTRKGRKELGTGPQIRLSVGLPGSCKQGAEVGWAQVFEEGQSGHSHQDSA
jgi:hypothetical protein